MASMFTNKQLVAITKSLEELDRRVKSAMAIRLQHDQVYDMLIRPSDKEALLHAEKIMQSSYAPSDIEFNFGTVKGHLSFTRNPAFNHLVPTYAKSGGGVLLLDDTQRGMIILSLEKQLGLRKTLARTEALIRYTNAKYSPVGIHLLRWYFPALSSLMSDDCLREKREQIRLPKNPGTRLSEGRFLAILKDAQAVIPKLLLLPSAQAVEPHVASIGLGWMAFEGCSKGSSIGFLT